MRSQRDYLISTVGNGIDHDFLGQLEQWAKERKLIASVMSSSHNEDLKTDRVTYLTFFGICRVSRAPPSEAEDQCKYDHS
jgi:hypothetical protein